MNKFVYNFLVGFLALLGAIPMEQGCEIRDYGPNRIWTISAKLPPVNKNISEEKVLDLLYDYTNLCRLFPDIIDVSPLSVKLYKDQADAHIYVSVF